MLIPLGIALVLGLACGALVNTFLLRTPDGLRFTAGRRKCVTCARPMHAKDHFPLVSYIVLQAKCRACKSIIPWQYPALEIAMGILFVGFAWQIFSGDVSIPFFARDASDVIALFIRNGILAMLLLPIFMFDWRASIIPDRLAIPAMVIVLTMNVAMGVDPTTMLFGGFSLGAFFALQYLVSRGTWVGGGDIRLAMVIGFLLGPELGTLALLFSYVLGSIAGLYLIFVRRRDMRSHVPFGTFMVIGTYLSLFFGARVIDWYLGILG
ncbi:MAG: prepilin peptidase [Patescibacteria group bacterium]|jgi:prepilin signal peptidase PulO-like enzyme (type II secretory pathway)